MIPAAGLGTRFLPATKALPKELLPVLERPVIEWAAEEAVAAGATDIVLVLAEGKDSVADHLRPDPELERILDERGKVRELEAVRHAGHLARVTVVHQPSPRGLGDAVLCAAEAVGSKPFLCMLPDDLSVAERPILAQLWDAHAELGTTVLALMRVGPDEISRYGCAEISESRGRRHRVRGLVEKPKPDEAKSDLAVMGRYVLTPDIFSALRATQPGALGEVQLTDGIAALLERGDVWGVEFEGDLLDVGTPAGWLQTNIRLAASDPALRRAVDAALASVAA
ncbi:MAG TPA: UTP--glucose-1-phosphate uridylyltransferase [Candidatus Dormibacteraeota bacterium]|nr:UTP--glucose-1-phosphate uridylyltransferase [Candidatus Dormibacteraeota bacterium]